MMELIKTNKNSNGEIIVSGRELYEYLEVNSNYTTWFNRMIEYGFEENTDYALLSNFGNQKGSGGHNKIDHVLKLPMAKELSMLQRSPKGKEARLYFLQLEEYWNSPEMIMKRALEFANERVRQLELDNDKLTKVNKYNEPKVALAEAIESSHSTILIREMAKILNQNGIDMGERRFFTWLRENGYLIKPGSNDYNTPTQKSVELGVIWLQEKPVETPKGTILTKTPRVTGKGQTYFVNKLLKKGGK